MMSAEKTITVDLADRSYPVFVGQNILHNIKQIIPESVNRVAIVTQRAVQEAIETNSELSKTSIGRTVDTGREQRSFFIGETEQEKSLSTVERLCEELVDFGITRGDLIIGLGGGLVTDVAGFVAAIYHRGLKVMHIPTTLLGQVDAAIGGKTAVNLSRGKNLAGAFWQPTAVVCDVATLNTLETKHWRCGLGEVAKYHFLGAGKLDDYNLVNRVARCVDIKAEVVAADEREGGRRAILNYGHTLAHALELNGEFGLGHGEAVAIGIVFAGEVSHRMGRINQNKLDEHYRVVSAYGLDTQLPENSDPQQLLKLFIRDKKAITGITMVLDGPRGVETVTELETEVLLGVLIDMQRR